MASFLASYEMDVRFRHRDGDCFGDFVNVNLGREDLAVDKWCDLLQPRASVKPKKGGLVRERVIETG